MGRDLQLLLDRHLPADAALLPAEARRRLPRPAARAAPSSQGAGQRAGRRRRRSRQLGGAPLLRLPAHRRGAATAKLFDSFRYKYDFPAAGVAERHDLPLVFERYLRPGDYTLIVKVEDLNGKVLPRGADDLRAGVDDAPARRRRRPDARRAKMLAEANAAHLDRRRPRSSSSRRRGELQAGMLRFDTLTTGTTSTG